MEMMPENNGFHTKQENKTFAPGRFLVSPENCERRTAMFIDADGVERDGRLIVPMGTAYPAGNDKPMGFVYEDVDVTDGSAVGSVVTKGTVYIKRVDADSLSEEAAAWLAQNGFVSVVGEPSVVRPY